MKILHLKINFIILTHKSIIFILIQLISYLTSKQIWKRSYEYGCKFSLYWFEKLL